MFGKLSNYLTSKTFWLIDILFIVCMVFLVKSAWGSLDYYSRWAALLLIVGASALLLIGLTWITGNMVLDWKRRSVAIQQQTPLPLPSLPTAKISEVDHSALVAPSQTARIAGAKRSRFHRSQRPQIATSASIAEEIASLQTGAKMQGATLQKPSAIGYRPMSNAIAKPQETALQEIATDETDELIMQAAQKMKATQGKFTGSGIAKMTGIAERTVYDRLEKLKQRMKGAS